MNLRRFLTTTIGLGMTAHGLAALRARRFQSAPDPIPYEELNRAPGGEERFVERLDGTRIHVRVDGSGPTVVLVHGYGVTLLEWALVWTELRRRGCRCVAFDVRGHGRSTIGSEGTGAAAMAADYLAVFEALDIHDAVLVGHSTGGFLALRALLDHAELSERVRGFVAFASLAGDALHGSLQNRLNIPLIRLGVTQRIVASPVYSWSFGAMFFGEDKPPAMIRRPHPDGAQRVGPGQGAHAQLGGARDPRRRRRVAAPERRDLTERAQELKKASLPTWRRRVRRS